MKKSVSSHSMEEKYYNEKVKRIGHNMWLLLTEPDEIDEINRFHIKSNMVAAGSSINTLYSIKKSY